uniref:L10-interacting MYB domain-containing protein-like n=1 Tax=Nelumbo nucifera TaxID=4432 RepID=A0A822YZ01_NELNU|nr:TPA_asm: hypothetical protein HUJ06_008553 [Nelumbo nucifera]
MPEGEQIEVGFNEYNQPNDGKTKDLVGFLGSLARTPNQLPIDMGDWREFPTETKEEIWKLIKKKFKVNDDTKDTLKSLGKKWRDWKSNLKKKYYDLDPDSADALPIEQLESRVNAHQWRNLV